MRLIRISKFQTHSHKVIIVLEAIDLKCKRPEKCANCSKASFTLNNPMATGQFCPTHAADNDWN